MIITLQQNWIIIHSIITFRFATLDSNIALLKKYSKLQRSAFDNFLFKYNFLSLDNGYYEKPKSIMAELCLCKADFNYNFKP